MGGTDHLQLSLCNGHLGKAHNKLLSTGTFEAEQIFLPLSVQEHHQMQQMFVGFGERLERRRRHIEHAHAEQEAQRGERMREVETLGRRLDSVSSNLKRLLDNMSRDSQR